MWGWSVRGRDPQPSRRSSAAARNPAGSGRYHPDVNATSPLHSLLLAFAIAGCDAADSPNAAPAPEPEPAKSEAPRVAAASPAPARADAAAQSQVAGGRLLPAHDHPPTPAAAAPAPTLVAHRPSPSGAIAVEIGDTHRAVEPVPSATAEGLSVTVHRYVMPKRTGDDTEDYWIQFQAWGEITNESSQTFETASARLVFYDAGGAAITTDSIASASQKDVGDTAPGENVYADVHFVAPGQSVPFHAMRNLAQINGEVASFAIVPRLGTAARGPLPGGVAVDVKDAIQGEGGAASRVLSGTIRNDGTAPCRDPYLVVALLDDAGHIGATETIIASDDVRKAVAMGESVAFSGKIQLYDDNAWKRAAPLRTWVDCKPPY